LHCGNFADACRTGAEAFGCKVEFWFGDL